MGYQIPRGHGSPYDRGSADSYYRRSRDPHWYPGGTYNLPRINAEQMTSAEIEEYHLGYDENEAEYNHKDYGDGY